MATDSGRIRQARGAQQDRAAEREGADAPVGRGGRPGEGGWPSVRPGGAPPAPGTSLLEEREIDEIERAWPNGMTSRQIVDVFETRGIRFSEATLRKYVQLGLLPRSVRVGRKGKHRGSCGVYPAHVIRRVNAVKGMMAEDRTIEEIQRSFARFKDDIDTVEKDLRDLIASFERKAKGPSRDAD